MPLPGWGGASMGNRRRGGERGLSVEVAARSSGGNGRQGAGVHGKEPGQELQLGSGRQKFHVKQEDGEEANAQRRGEGHCSEWGSYM